MEFDINAIDIINNVSKNRFEATINGAVAVVEYMRPGNRIVFTHTEVPKELEGKGIAGKLAKTALDYAQQEQLQIMPLCPYIAAYIRRHPEYQSLVLPGYGF